MRHPSAYSSGAVSDKRQKGMYMIKSFMITLVIIVFGGGFFVLPKMVGQIARENKDITKGCSPHCGAVNPEE